jgi:hypothetical protein
LRINPDFIIEFHGPLVLAGQAILEPQEFPAAPSSCDLGHTWVAHPSGGWTCQTCQAHKTGGL